jgi:hypothetical protein
VLGTPENPMSVSEVSAKARDLIEPVVGAEKTKKLIEQVLTIERLASVRALQPLLKP